MAGGNDRQIGPSRSRGRGNHSGTSHSTGGRTSGRESGRTGSGERHYRDYARSAALPRLPININQVPPSSSTPQQEEDIPPVDPVDEEVEHEVEQDEVDDQDYSSIITRAEEYQRQPGREGLTWLNPLRPPNTLWFLDNEVSSEVTNCMQAYFKSPITSWSKGDMRHYEQWFLAFAQKFNWEPSITFTVWEAFKAKGIDRLKDNTCNMKRKYGRKGDKAKPSWVKPSVWTGVKEYWARPASIARAIKNSVARSKNKAKHTSGQIGFSKRQLMEADADGNVPPFHSVFDKVHQRKDGSYITPESEQLVHQTQQLIEERSTQMSPGGSSVASTNALSVSEQNAIFTELAPKNKKGKVVGLGSIQNPTFHCRERTSQFPGYVSQEAWEQSQATIQQLRDEMQTKSTCYEQTFQSLQEQISEMRQMFHQQANVYRPTAYDPGNMAAGPSAPPDGLNEDLDVNNINISLDDNFEFPPQQ